MHSFKDAAEQALTEALTLRQKHGEPEAIDLTTYTTAEALQRAGITELTLEEHASMVQTIEQKLKAHGFNVVVHLLPYEG